ncbi:hypothetical protein APHAL10511_003145 [Amanita phalloides]|nr:hypothetical protein APHAL10511_003145 [Amanita phalloides]
MPVSDAVLTQILAQLEAIHQGRHPHMSISIEYQAKATPSEPDLASPASPTSATSASPPSTSAPSINKVVHNAAFHAGFTPAQPRLIRKRRNFFTPVASISKLPVPLPYILCPFGTELPPAAYPDQHGIKPSPLHWGAFNYRMVIEIEASRKPTGNTGWKARSLADVPSCR